MFLFAHITHFFFIALLIMFCNPKLLQASNGGQKIGVSEVDRVLGLKARRTPCGDIFTSLRHEAERKQRGKPPLSEVGLEEYTRTHYVREFSKFTLPRIAARKNKLDAILRAYEETLNISGDQTKAAKAFLHELGRAPLDFELADSFSSSAMNAADWEAEFARVQVESAYYLRAVYLHAYQAFVYFHAYMQQLTLVLPLEHPLAEAKTAGLSEQVHQAALNEIMQNPWATWETRQRYMCLEGNPPAIEGNELFEEVDRDLTYLYKVFLDAHRYFGMPTVQATEDFFVAADAYRHARIFGSLR